MKITSFRAEKVFGYLDFEIIFHRDINFLVGGNGSGKTTALRLINAMLAPDFHDLILLTFANALLMVESFDVPIFIAATTEGDYKTLAVSGCAEKLILPSFKDYDLEKFARSPEKLDELVTEYYRRFADHPVVKTLVDLSLPIFLGLDRQTGGTQGPLSDYYDREMRKRSKNDRDRYPVRRGPLGANTGILETELLVQESYSRLRELEDAQAITLRDTVLLSAFKFNDYSITASAKDEWKDRSMLPKRKKEIKEALSKIGVKDSRLGSELDKFFERLTQLFEDEKDVKPQDRTWALLNRAQIDRMFEVVEIIDDHKSKIDHIFEPINKFLSTVNSFFRESNKVLELDVVGRITIKRPDGVASTLDGLSSGEMQLLVIFAHALLHRGKVGSERVFILDEPELSLHMSWQERFSETIFGLSPSTQFIMATHSPEIVGAKKSHVVRCR